MELPLWLLAALGAAVIIEQMPGYRAGWRWRRPLALAAALLLAVASTGLLLAQLSVVTVGITIVSWYSIVNMARIVRRRGQVAGEDEQLFQAANVTSACLGSAHIVLGMLAVITWQQGWPWQPWLVVLAAVQCAVAVGLWRSVNRQLRTTAPPAGITKASVADNKLPAITVAVPARNEGMQLEACLDAILANDYPKLEVIVLDDGSADKTPEIIRSYAHAGVRFVRGDAPDAGWLPKNQVYAKLAQEANGKLILFCGVDVRLAPGSIRALEQLMFTKQKAMVDVLPQNQVLGHLPLAQAMRYYWEMAPPRRRFRRPPVLSSCWLIEKAELEHAGGFAAVKRSISPEAHFAREAIRHDAYSFVRSNQALGITSEKDIREQYETALFMRYPQLHRRPEMVGLLSVAELALLVGPLMVSVAALTGVLGSFGDAGAGVGHALHGWLAWAAAALSLAALSIHMWAFVTAQRQVFTRPSRLNCMVRFLPAVLYDVFLLNWSMLSYEFGTVIWKGRAIHEPVMRVIPRLPEMPPEPPNKINPN